MIKVKVKKLFNGKISIRDYLVKQAIENNESILVFFNKREMLITPQVLETGITNNYVFQSRYDNKEYKLLDYEWKPIEQISLF